MRFTSKPAKPSRSVLPGETAERRPAAASVLEMTAQELLAMAAMSSSPPSTTNDDPVT
jgi:hypothetical protein